MQTQTRMQIQPYSHMSTYTGPQPLGLFMEADGLIPACFVVIVFVLFFGGFVCLLPWTE